MMDNFLDAQYALSEVIYHCIFAVKNDRPFDACPWMLIEEKFGSQITKELFYNSIFSSVLITLDDYCLSAEHGETDVNGHSIEETAQFLALNAALMKNGCWNGQQSSAAGF